MTNNKPSIALGEPFTSPKAFKFFVGDECLLALTHEGFEYQGRIVKDEGEAYRLFREWLKSVNL